MGIKVGDLVCTIPPVRKDSRFVYGLGLVLQIHNRMSCRYLTVLNCKTNLIYDTTISYILFERAINKEDILDVQQLIVKYDRYYSNNS